MIWDRLVVGTCVIAALMIGTAGFPDGPISLAIVIGLALPLLFVFRRYTEQQRFITNVFLFGLALRLIFGALLRLFDLRGFFGSDAFAYDTNGVLIADLWLGHIDTIPGYGGIGSPLAGVGWGMFYFTGGVYYLLGRDILAAQSIVAVFGAATAPMAYYCAHKIFGNIRTAKISAILIAAFPSFVIWSGQLLKDGFLLFFIVLVITMTLVLQEKLNYLAIVALLIGMGGIISLRFYIFYMVGVAVVGSFLMNFATTTTAMIRTLAVLTIIGFGLTYFGAADRASFDYQNYGSLERVQISRNDLARSASSGFAVDADVSTTRGALLTLPVGLMYLMLAPFPWQAANLRQAITIPEVLAWWILLPLGVSGILYTLRHRLRKALPVLLFTVLLTVAYSLFQGNVGTAYRQRTQIQVFIFIFIAVGWTLRQEKKENRRMQSAQRERAIRNGLRRAVLPQN
jgi:hypothetical protein